MNQVFRETNIYVGNFSNFSFSFFLFLSKYVFSTGLENLSMILLLLFFLPLTAARDSCSPQLLFPHASRVLIIFFLCICRARREPFCFDTVKNRKKKLGRIHVVLVIFKTRSTEHLHPHHRRGITLRAARSWAHPIPAAWSRGTSLGLRGFRRLRSGELTSAIPRSRRKRGKHRKCEQSRSNHDMHRH